MNSYMYGGDEIDSVELKCLVVSRGLKVDKEVYKRYQKTSRLDVNPLTCNCFFLSDGTIVQLTDMGFHLKYLSGILSWNNLKLLRYASELTTPFSIRMQDDKPALFGGTGLLDFITFPEPTDFYKQKTTSGLPFIGNSVLQGTDWVAFQCLWYCEYAAAGKPCEFCFSGGDFETLARKGRELPQAVTAVDVADIVRYAAGKVKANNVQITGGSTFDGAAEEEHIRSYLQALSVLNTNEILLYITPPKANALLDEYFALGASRIACSLELWDEEKAKIVTPGKMDFTTRERYLDALTYIADKHGPGSAFSNFIIGIEDFETLRTGATELASCGILPSASVWMPMGRPVLGSMSPPGVDYYRRVKELFAELYVKYSLFPPETRGLNVCIERDIRKYADT
jgi:hypothetical protein